MRLLVALLLLLAGCGAAEEKRAPLVEEAKATWRLTHTGRGVGVYGPIAATGPNEAWSMIRRKSTAPASLMRWDGASWRPAVMPKGFGRSLYGTLAASPSGNDLWLFCDSCGDGPWQLVEGRW
ncbi:hypothetical protein GCM10020216_053240 [Nonomuraea helvata]